MASGPPTLVSVVSVCLLALLCFFSTSIFCRFFFAELKKGVGFLKGQLGQSEENNQGYPGLCRLVLFFPCFCRLLIVFCFLG